DVGQRAELLGHGIPCGVREKSEAESLDGKAGAPGCLVDDQGDDQKDQGRSTPEKGAVDPVSREAGRFHRFARRGLPAIVSLCRFASSTFTTACGSGA